MDNITQIGDYVDDAELISPIGCLHHCINLIGNEDAFKNCKKLMVIALDDNDNIYDVSFRNAGMKCSQMLSLLEITKKMIMDEMGYN